MKDDVFSETLRGAFCNRLRFLRNKRGISAREMSLALGQNVNYVNLIENGKRLPSMEGFFFICEYFGLTPAEFFQEEFLTVQQTKGGSPSSGDYVMEILTLMDSHQQRLLLDFVRSLLTR